MKIHYLIWDHGVKDGFTPLTIGTVVTIGRSAASSVAIFSGDVSRNHATVTRLGDGCYLTDLGSTNGTTVNGDKVKDTIELKNGDRITFGGCFTANYRVNLSPEELEKVFDDRLETFTQPESDT